MGCTRISTTLRARVRARSTRARVLGWFMLIVAIALGFNILVVHQVMHTRASATIDTELRHEVVKFREYARRSVDPSTGERFADVESLLRTYLADAVPEGQEALFSVIDGRAMHRTRNPVPVRLDRDVDVLDTVARTRGEPSTHTVETSAGTARYAIVPVDTEGAGTSAALVIVEFTSGAQEDVAQVVKTTALASALALLIAGAIAWLVAGRILAPLRQVRRTAEVISESDLSRRIEVVPDVRDDVARLAVTFNGMLDRLETAFGTQRAFLDDAAHELRTPLTVIRGHLELMGDDPNERLETTTLLLEEIARMDRIVDELLVLAAAERPDFLSLDEVDLTDLVVGVLARVSALAPRCWTVAESADVLVVADAQRLTQALVQLAANGLRFTEDGDRLSIGSVLRDGQVVLTVKDSGAGVPVQLKKTVFDRFTRGQDRVGGAGLGLAIVRSIAVAHGGDARVSDTPGGGATFSLTFPARFPVGSAGRASRRSGRNPQAESDPIDAEPREGR